MNDNKPLIQTTRGGQASPLVKCERRHDDEMAAEAGETNGAETDADATQDMSMTKKTGDTTPKVALPLGEAAVDTQQHGSCVMKRSPLWKTIEAMEAFQALPQNPHFRPLLDCQEEIREGLAIGNMVAFVSLVEKASHLLFDDPKSTLDSIFAGLVELETHGFDVRPVQHRVLSLKLSSEPLTKQSEVVEARIREHHRNWMMEELEMRLRG